MPFAEMGIKINKQKNFILFFYAIFSLLFCGFLFAKNVYATDCTTAFGSNYYNAVSGGDAFPIGVYLRSESGIGEYNITLSFDDTRLSYTNGGASSKDNNVTISGNGQGSTEVKAFVYFKATSGGESGVSFKSATVNAAQGETKMNITSLAEAPVHISGTDTSKQDYEEVLKSGADTSDDAQNPEGDNDDEISDDAENSDEDNSDDNIDDADNKADSESEQSSDDASVRTETSESDDTEDINDQTDKSKDGFSDSRKAKNKKLVTYVLIAIVVVLIIIISIFILRLRGLLHNSYRNEEDFDDEEGASDDDDSDDDGIWDEIKRKH